MPMPRPHLAPALLAVALLAVALAAAVTLAHPALAQGGPSPTDADCTALQAAVDRYHDVVLTVASNAVAEALQGYGVAPNAIDAAGGRIADAPVNMEDGAALLAAERSLLARAGCAPAPEAMTEPVRALRRLYDDLLGLKDSRDFRRRGFTPGGPYHEWLAKLEALRARWPERVDLPAVLRRRACATAPAALQEVGRSLAHGRQPTWALLKNVLRCVGAEPR